MTVAMFAEGIWLQDTTKARPVCEVVSIAENLEGGAV